MTPSQQTQALVDAVCAILGTAAPAAGTPRYQKLFVDAGPMLASARTDHASYLADSTRDALLEALGTDRASASGDGFVHEAVRDGYHGCAFASDDELLAMCAGLSIDQILSAAAFVAAGASLGTTDKATAAAAHAEVLRDLCLPAAVEIVAAMLYETEFDELPTTLNAALERGSLPNPYAALLDLHHDAPADAP
ncbi:hypothetical protein [Variovorax gossypii]|jgi:hypothetical protein